MEKIGIWQNQSNNEEQGEERSSTFIELKQRNISKDLIMLSNNRKVDFRSKSYSGPIKKFNDRNIFREAVHNNFAFIDGASLDLDLDNPKPRIGSGFQKLEDQNMLIKTILAADSVSLDLTLKRMNYSIDITEIISKENGYSLLHWAVFKDSDNIVYSLWKNVIENPSEPFETKKK